MTLISEDVSGLLAAIGIVSYRTEDDAGAVVGCISIVEKDKQVR